MVNISSSGWHDWAKLRPAATTASLRRCMLMLPAGKSGRPRVVEVDGEHLVVRMARPGAAEGGSHYSFPSAMHADAAVDGQPDRHRCVGILEELDAPGFAVFIYREGFAREA